MNIQETVQHISQNGDAAIKGSGLLGGAVSLVGATADLSHWSEISQIAANFGIGIGGMAAMGTLIYTLYTAQKKNKDA